MDFLKLITDIVGAVAEFFSLLPGTVTALLVMLCSAVPVLRPPLEAMEAWLVPVGLWAVVLMIFGFLFGWLLKGFRVRWINTAGLWIFRLCALSLMLSAFWAAGRLAGWAIKNIL